MYRVGKPYTVAGRVYIPEEDVNYSAIGLASWYGDDFHGRFTANGEVFDMNSISAAHKTLPLPSYVRVTNLANRRSIVVRGQRPRALCWRSRHRPVGQDRAASRLLRSRRRQGEGRLRRSRPARRFRRSQAGGDAARVHAGHGAGHGSGQRQQNLRPSLFRRPPDDPIGRQSADAAGTALQAGEGAREIAAADVDTGAPTTELAAAKRPQRAEPITRRALAAVEPAEPSVSPVSAYAPTRYDAVAGFMSGRGLY